MQEPSVGLVIGTFAAVPYIHVALESRRRNYPRLPVLVNDDCSPKRDELRALCSSYGAEFLSNERRLGWPTGDLWSFYNGFAWARRRNLKFLVKMSRRFIPLHNWLPDFRRLAFETRAATFGNECSQSGMRIRTECVGFDAERWSEFGAAQRIKRIADSLTANIWVERFIYNLSLDVAARLRETGDTDHAPTKNHPFEAWSLVPDNRGTPRPDVLWHNADRAFDYHRVAVLFELDYSFEDFADVNQGYGDGQGMFLKKPILRCGC